MEKSKEECLLMNGIMSYDLKGKESNIFKAMDDFANQPKPTLWTPITGEASLPTDDEALCLFVEFNDAGICTGSTFDNWGHFKKYENYNDFTHYTILQPPVK